MIAQDLGLNSFNWKIHSLNGKICLNTKTILNMISNYYKAFKLKLDIKLHINQLSNHLINSNYPKLLQK